MDHQGINFKQNDLKNIRPKSLVREIEQILEEVGHKKFFFHYAYHFKCFALLFYSWYFILFQRADQLEEGNAEVTGPHFNFSYFVSSVMVTLLNCLLFDNFDIIYYNHLIF